MRDLESMEYHDETVMTNFDHSIDREVARLLRERPNELYAQYSGWNFCGYVWHNGENWTCQVWNYRSPKEEITEDTLEDIMNEVCSNYGSD